MLLAEIKTIFQQELQEYYSKEETDAFFYETIHHFLNLERFVLVMQPALTVTKEEEKPLFETLARLKNEEPLQYILGETQFMDFKIKVNPNVLIPRPETEELVAWVTTDFTARSSPLKLLDVGTGSGCIAIALSKLLPEAKVTALDVSTAALKVAKANALLNNAQVAFLEANVLTEALDLDEQFDVLVSNPPYVRELEKKEMANNVKLYEPEMALYVPDDNALLFYQALAKLARNHLTVGGSIYLEINQYLGKATQQLFVDKNFTEIELKKDIFGNDRMLRAVWNG